MSGTEDLKRCTTVCWGLAVLAGLVVLWITSAMVGLVAALVLGVVIALLLGIAATRLVCSGAASVASGDSGGADAGEPSEGTGAAGPPAAATRDESEAAEPERAVPEAPASTEPPAAVRSGTLLSGEEELAARKGEWRYGSAGPAAATGGGAAAVGTPPERLESPRGGQADDLKRIKGVGPKLEAMLNEMGFFHFDQIAAWNVDEVSWVDASIKGFKGRVSRDDWVSQARKLAAGEETEFSRRVEDGDVY